MKFVTERPYADPETAARKLIEIAQHGRGDQGGGIGFPRRSFWPALRRWNWRG
jgi:hypothetical protein